MKRVAHPTCVACGKLHPEFESRRFGIKVCYSCLLECATGFHRRGLLFAGHILVTELFSGVFSGGVIETQDIMPVAVRADTGSSTFSFFPVEKYSESETNA